MNFKFDRAIICPWDTTATEERIKQYEEYYRIKYDIIKSINPSVIVEIGVRAGYSAWTFLQACPKAKYYGLDADNKKHGGQGKKAYIPWAEKILQGYDYEIRWPVDTQKLNRVDIEADFYHIDGDHTRKGVMHDLDICYKAARNNGVLLIDDYDYIPDVRCGVDDWISSNDVIYEYRKSLRGEIIIRKKNENSF